METITVSFLISSVNILSTRTLTLEIAMSNRQPDSYDFRDLQEALQQFLSTHPDFKDVNWKGSVAARMVDLHAYNTSINASSVGFAFNESSINSATIRSNVAAKASGILNYLPASKRCSEILVKLDVRATGINPDEDIAFDRDVRFNGVSNQVSLNFVPDGTYRANLVDGYYTFPEVKLLQGERITNRFVVKTSEGIETYIIPNQRIDINTLKVMVKEGDSLQTYTRYQHPNQLGKNNKLYYVRINPEGKYVLEFGDDVFSRRLQYGESVIVDYIATLGSEGNGAAKLSASGLIGGSTDITITVLSEYSKGGADEESIESIKRLAPLGFGANGVCVTPSDFIAAVKRFMGDSVSVNAWGGEQNDPPKYGYTFIAARYKNGTNLDQMTKDNLQEQIQPLCVGQITPLIKDADIFHLSVDVDYEYNPKRTVLSRSQLNRKIEEAVKTYSSKNLENFSTDFDHNMLNAFIKSIDNSIISADTQIKIYKEITEAEVGYYYNGKIEYGSAILGSSVLVSGFKPIETNSDKNDYRLVVSGKELVMERVNKVTGSVSVYPGKYGSVDETKGVVYIQNLYIDELEKMKAWAQRSALDKSMKANKGVIFQLSTGTINGVSL